MENIKPISKSHWIDEYEKITTQYKIEERNLIQNFLVHDYHLSKIFKSLLQDDILSEKKVFFDTEKTLKFCINEAYSYIISQNVTRAGNNELNSKIKKIDNLLIKVRRDFKTKFESLLSEEETLEKELLEADKNFELMFNNDKEEKDNGTSNMDENNKVGEQGVNNKKVDMIDNYINSILSNPGIIYDNNDLTFNEIEKIVKKFNYSNLNLIKEKVEIIDVIIDKKLGGITLNWQQKEHEDFLKIKNLHNGKIYSYEFLTELSNTIPYLPSSELKNHIKLYDKYYHLFELKKILIKKYKEIKQQREEEEKNKILEKIKNDKNALNKKPSIDYDSLENKKKMVRDWKEQKEKQNQELLKEKLKAEKENKEREKMIYLMKKEKNQYILEEYKRKKEYENYVRSNTSLTNQPVNPIDIERIREREEKLLEKKKNVLRAKSSKNFKAEETYSKYKLMQNKKYGNIETKINQTTEGFKNKQRTKFNPKTDKGKDACTMANNLLGHMSRAVPAWRKGFV